jgi:solute carrier family 6 amino acid transporter-like protein 5/7/9/14
MSDGIGNLGGFNWHLALCLAIAWILLFLSISRGVKSLGKVAYFTAL